MGECLYFTTWAVGAGGGTNDGPVRTSTAIRRELWLQLTKRARLNGDAEKVTLRAGARANCGHSGRAVAYVRETGFASIWPFREDVSHFAVNHKPAGFVLKEFGSANSIRSAALLVNSQAFETLSLKELEKNSERT